MCNFKRTITYFIKMKTAKIKLYFNLTVYICLNKITCIN